MDTVLNLEKVDTSLKVDLSIDSVLTEFGLKDCIVPIDIKSGLYRGSNHQKIQNRVTIGLLHAIWGNKKGNKFFFENFAFLAVCPVKNGKKRQKLVNRP